MHRCFVVSQALVVLVHKLKFDLFTPTLLEAEIILFLKSSFYFYLFACVCLYFESYFSLPSVATVTLILTAVFEVEVADKTDSIDNGDII